MGTERKATRRFRSALQEELRLWRAEGIVSDDQAKTLERRYALGELAAEGTSLLMTVIYTIGALLIAGGVISFIAAHWTFIPKPAKVALLLAAMIGAHGSGYWLWRVRGSKPKLGHALVILGTLIFGANIGLMAQIFHIESHYYNGFLAWSLGAAAVAYALGSAPNAVIAIATSFIWYCGWKSDYHFEHALSLYPPLIAACGLPFIYWRKAGFTYLLLALAVSISFLMDVGAATDSFQGWMLGGAALALLLTAYGAWHRVVHPLPEIGVVSLWLGGIALATFAYLLSFGEMAHSLTREIWRHYGDQADLFLIVGAFCVVAMAGLSFAILSAMESWRDPVLRRYSLPLMAGMALFLLAVSGWTGQMATVFLANLACLALGVGLIWSGVAAERRSLFWLGAAFFALLILSRFLEYRTGLMLKAVAFLACGAGVIYGGIKFEGYLRVRRAARALRSTEGGPA